MKNKMNVKLVLLGLAVSASQFLCAQNPIIQTHYTADPSPIILNDTLFLYVGCDEKDAPNNAYLMREYRLYTTTDMVNWTDHGARLRTSDFSWSAGDASAAQCIERDGKYYWYISSQNKVSPGSSIGVAMADSPYGPFHDPINKGLVTNNMTTAATHIWDDLDPTVFIDDDGQAYLFWGNGACYWAKLNKDMISLAGPITALDVRDNTQFYGRFTEGPWVYKRNGLYYLIYAAGFPESIHYSTAKSPEGPWEARGVVMPREGGSSTNHPGMIDYKGNSYFFYHNDALPGGHSHCRSVCVEQFKYNADGTIPQMTMTEGIIKGVGTLNPYRRVEAETIAWSEGITTIQDEKVGLYVNGIHNGDFLKVRDVDFGQKGAAKFTANVASRYHGGKIEIRLGSRDGELIGALNAPYTGEWDSWQVHSTNVTPVKGIHDVYFVFTGRTPHELFNFDYWMFSE